MSHPGRDDIDDDVPTNMFSGWRLGGRSYFDANGIGHNQRTQDWVVTRPEGYVPYQSIVQPDGRHAYDPNAFSRDQYPRTRHQELGRTALLPAARQYEFMLNRSDHYPHQPGEAVEMGLNYNQMRTQPWPANPIAPSGSGYIGAQQPMLDQYGRSMLLQGSAVMQAPLQGPMQGPMMGPPPDPRYPPGGYGGNGGGRR